MPLKESKNGFFPDLFNRTENQEYVGEIPSQDYYDPQSMSESRRKEFEAWQRARRKEGYEFAFQPICLLSARCEEGMLKFQEDLETLAEFNSMSHCFGM